MSIVISRLSRPFHEIKVLLRPLIKKSLNFKHIQGIYGPIQCTNPAGTTDSLSWARQFSTCILSTIKNEGNLPVQITPILKTFFPTRFRANNIIVLLTSTTDVCPVNVVWASMTRPSLGVVLISQRQIVCKYQRQKHTSQRLNIRSWLTHPYQRSSRFGWLICLLPFFVYRSSW